MGGKLAIMAIFWDFLIIIGLETLLFFSAPFLVYSVSYNCQLLIKNNCSLSASSQSKVYMYPIKNTRYLPRTPPRWKTKTRGTESERKGEKKRSFRIPPMRHDHARQPMIAPLYSTLKISLCMMDIFNLSTNLFINVLALVLQVSRREKLGAHQPHQILSVFD